MRRASLFYLCTFVLLLWAASKITRGRRDRTVPVPVPVVGSYDTERFAIMTLADVEKILSELTLDEKVALTTGIDLWHTAAIERLGIPSLRLTDGPSGVRGTRFFNGVPTARLPCSTALGASWDVELLKQIGQLLGEEVIAKGSHVLLGPTINIQRTPLGGRGFDSFSEDGVLSGTLAGYYCQGVQEKGVAATLKHFVCNDQEHERMWVNIILMPRALREIYLLPFQMALRICKPASIMTALNKVNGTYVSENRPLIHDVLRQEWNWNGLIMSDWFGTHSTSDPILAGLDLEMPGKTNWRGKALVDAVLSDKELESALNDRVRNILGLVNWVGKSGVPENAPQKPLDRPEDRALLRRAAAESVVLLKNEGQILPLDRKKSVLVIGPNAKIVTSCGGGSSSLNPYYSVSPFDGVVAHSEGEVLFVQGVYSHKELPQLGPLLKTMDGRAGFTFCVYDAPPTEEERVMVDKLHLTQSSASLMDYAHPRINSSLFYIDMEGYYTPEQDGVYDFGVTVLGTGKLFVDDELVVDNSKNQRRGTAFFGCATVEETGSKQLKSGQTYKVTFQFGTAPTSDLDTGGITGFGPGLFRFGAIRRASQEELIANAVDSAAQADQVVLFAGLTSEWESEGFDRDHMDLPPGSDELITQVLQANANTVVVIQSGMPVTMPWAKDAKALLQAWYGGNEGGNGIADVLYGDVNPSAKLPVTFPSHLRDTPSYLNSRAEQGRILYGEDIYVGYRYYEKSGRVPLFPFGHGLSYTTFTRAALTLGVTPEKPKLEDGETIKATVLVTNTGSVAGAEIIQLWISPPSSMTVSRPPRELKGLAKVFLEAGESKEVEIVVEKKLATSYWDERQESWLSEQGEYTVLITGTGKETVTASFSVEQSRHWLGL